MLWLVDLVLVLIVAIAASSLVTGWPIPASIGYIRGGGR